MNKIVTLLTTALLVVSGVACSGGGPSDEFCDAAVEWASELGNNLGAGETGSVSYAQLEAGVAEITASLDDMAAATDEEAVLEDIATVKTAFEEFAETRDIAALEPQEAQEASNGIEAYAADCEGFEEAATAAAEEAEELEEGSSTEEGEGEEVDEGLEALQTVVSNAAIAQESYFTSELAYTDSVDDLAANGFEVPEGIAVEITLAGKDGYCVQASDDSGSVMRYDSSVGQPEQGECP